MIRRLFGAWRSLDRERRRAALAAGALTATLFLPWYSESIVAMSAGARSNRLRVLQPETLTAWQAFSWAEALLLIVALGVLALLFRHGEGRPLRLPGGDGWVLAASGGFGCLLVVWRMFNVQAVGGHGQFVVSTGIDWGIFVALLVAVALALAGNRIRGGGRRAAPAAGDDTDFDGRWHRASGAGESGRRPGRGRPRRRSSWSPAERPEWTSPQTNQTEQTDQTDRTHVTAPLGAVPAWPDFSGRTERPVGWLTAPPRHLASPTPGQGEGSE